MRMLLKLADLLLLGLENDFLIQSLFREVIFGGDGLDDDVFHFACNAAVFGRHLDPQ